MLSRWPWILIRGIEREEGVSPAPRPSSESGKLGERARRLPRAVEESAHSPAPGGLIAAVWAGTGSWERTRVVCSSLRITNQQFQSRPLGGVFAFLARPGINRLRGTEFLPVGRIGLKPEDPVVEAGIGPEVQVPRIGKIRQPNPGAEGEPAFESLASHRHGTVERPALAPDGQRQGLARFALVHDRMALG